MKNYQLISGTIFRGIFTNKIKNACVYTKYFKGNNIQTRNDC